ncbi:Glyoxalase/Bleomycin resistance protein/Dioxygenase superfamily protein [Sulfitobacter sp. THAF37]|uniref:VOC family protein n=1 Tax=Sulfitobacter sp. THAF37 TaxID=2587855 RepID=UPI001267CDA6|nr:VOC family protein [Sulfitobacter sp. THAF37]QFT60383.1 Glyoxalase/Bleomycin resistance protein/Dioxygenase superfamily protein [Sulfitobacter sp. THAF37]
MRLSALTLIVPDYDEAIAYYCGTLGFVLAEDIDQGRKRWVRVTPTGGGSGFILARADGEAQRAAIGNQGAGRVWLFLQTDDFERDYNALRAKGVTFEETPRQEVYGTVAVFRDCFGNRWDLIGDSGGASEG